MNREFFDWTIEREQILRDVWNEDYATIIQALGGGVTNDAIKKKGARLGLPLRGRRAPKPRTKLTENSEWRILFNPTLDQLFVRPGIGETIWTIKDGYCRFPFGDPRRRDFYLCGNDVKEGKAYCPMHCDCTQQKAYVPGTPKVPRWVTG